MLGISKSPTLLLIIIVCGCYGQQWLAICHMCSHYTAESTSMSVFAVEASM